MSHEDRKRTFALAAAAAPIDDDAIDRTYTWQERMPFNLSGHPAIAVPTGLSSTGLPLGMQAAGRHFDEATVYGVASALEEARPRPQHWASSGTRRHAIPEGAA